MRAQLLSTLLSGHPRLETGVSPQPEEGADHKSARLEATGIALRWLVAAGLVDWLITRTLTRAAIFMPKSPVLIGVYQTVSVLGIVAGIFASLLASGMLVWLAWRAWKHAFSGTALLTFSLLVLSLVSLFTAAGGWGRVAFQVLYLTLLVALCWHSWRRRRSAAHLLAGWLPGLVLMAGGVSHLLPALYEAAGWPGPAPEGRQVFNLGELLLAVTPMMLWWAYGRTAAWRDWLLAGTPALAFAAFHLANPAMAGILAIWSTGLTLYLPWPVYALSLWLAGVTAITASRWGGPVCPAILLLAAGGYAPQLSSQIFYGLIALWLLCRPQDISAENRV